MSSAETGASLDSLRIPVGEVSLSSRLGGYYLDLTSVLPLVESGYHGPLDPRGVPMSRVGPGAPVYSVITIAQYALALHDACRQAESDALTAKLRTQLEAILEQVEWRGLRRGFSVHHWTDVKYKNLRAPWVSALSQGNAISALLRGHELLGDRGLLEAASLMFEALEQPLETGGVRDTDICGHLWFEEYPTEPPLHVLNGFIFALWGVLDFARMTGNEKAWRWWNQGVETLRAHLPEFDCGYWSVYDLRYRELVSRHYQVNVHVPQLNAMHRLTGDEVFRVYAERWRRFADRLWCRGRWWISLRVHALRRGYRFD